jgi:alkanesulfonate monooxygenase SsuD/methylene tetrahydromethanopterin reductase-like flavin-dependent oxidoreductase (luciferase family)
VGWNHVEYEALGQSFESRGARIEEQVDLLRALWTDELVAFDGEFHSVPDAGINPLPEQRPIPLWMGGGAPPVLDRVGRTADGWLPLGPPNDDRREELAAVRAAAADAGRDPDNVGVRGQLPLDPERPEQWLRGVENWDAFGATHLTVTTTRTDLVPGEHERLVARFADELADAGRSLG